MATKEQIKKAILDASGNPDTGIVRDNVDAWAEAVWLLDNPKSEKEIRVIESKETR
jgi:hypothetical protein